MSQAALPASTNLAAGVAEDIRGIKAPVAIPSLWTWIGWSLVVVVAALLAWWAWRWWRRKQAEVTIVIPPSPDAKALAALNEALSWIGQPRLYCQAVSVAIRLYLEERFNLHAPDRTTEEFLDELRLSALLALDQKQTLGDFLTQCDLVKFARYEPSPTELQGLHDAAVRLVVETRPAPPPPVLEPEKVTP